MISLSLYKIFTLLHLAHHRQVRGLNISEVIFLRNKLLFYFQQSLIFKVLYFDLFDITDHTVFSISAQIFQFLKIGLKKDLFHS